jgi:hypothetical protein
VRKQVARAAAALVGTGLAATVLTGCGGDDGPGPNGASSLAAATVRTANCDSWNAASADEQSQLVRGMREFFSGQVDSPGMVGKALPDEKATQLFNSYCAQSFAGAFSLYRLYGNAAAFTNPQK